MCFWRLGEASKQQWNPLSENGNQECLVLRIDWTNQNSLLENTTRQLNEVKRETELHVKAVEQQHAEKAQESQDKFRKDLEAANDKLRVNHSFQPVNWEKLILFRTFYHFQDVKAQMKQQALDNENRVAQLRSEFESERKRMEDAHQTKLANAYKRHEELEDQIQEMQCKHIMQVPVLWPR